MNSWISVKDSLPEVNHYVLVTNGEDIYIGFYGDYDDEFYWADSCGEVDDKITHWIPLPKLPQEKNEKSAEPLVTFIGPSAGHAKEPWPGYFINDRKDCLHEYDTSMLLLSNPPKIKCKKCNKYFVQKWVEE